MKRYWLIALTLSCANLSCKKTPPAEAPPAPPPPIVVRDKPGLLFTYLDSVGQLKTADKLTDIPKDHRRGVRVIDLTVPPEARGAGKFIVIADLTTASADGTFPYQLLSPIDFDKAVSGAAIQHKVGEALAHAQDRITMYSTSWCPVCAKARAYFNERKIPFQDRDVENDESARAELSEKARLAKVAPQGVPVIDVFGQLVLGFDEPHIEAILHKHDAMPQHL
jgi:glutaredoxin